MKISIQNHKFGTIKGVLIPNITMMFGVILFLRLGVIAASSGIWQMLAVIALSLAVMTITSLSIGSLATNMNVGDGGVYYIISRSLGVEVGGAIGIAIYFAQLISIALTISGFALSFQLSYPQFSLLQIEAITIFLLALISAISASWALQLQIVIFSLLLVSLGSIFMGSATGLQAVDPSLPFYGKGGLSFWQSFALFYPALTGIEAGMALSGSLKNPGKSLLWGNLLSLFFVAFIYAVLSIFVFNAIPYEILASNPFALVSFSKYPALVTMGIWAATLSSALGCILGAPRMLQSMAQDGILNEFLAKTQGKRNEPRIALVVTSLAALFIVAFTTIDQIIPMLAMICLISYGLLNFVAAFSELTNIPSWRPQIRISWGYSALGLTLIVVCMFMIAPGWSFLTILLLVSVYLLIKNYDIETGFQDLRNSLIFFISRLAIYRLEENDQVYALSWHPQILAFIPAPEEGEKLIYLSHSLTRRSGILTFITVVPEDWANIEKLDSMRSLLSRFFEKKSIACINDVYPSENVLDGYQQVIKAYGIGHIQPNTIALQISDRFLNEDFLSLIDTCRLMKKNILLFLDNKILPVKFFRNRKIGKHKTIDIWWNPEDNQSLDLVWSLVTTLKDGFVFNKANVTIKAKVSDYAESSVSDYLNKYIKDTRLQAKVKVFHDENIPDEHANLTFFCLTPLSEDANDDERKQYLKYLQDTVNSFEGKSEVFLLTSYDQVNHGSIYLSEGT